MNLSIFSSEISTFLRRVAVFAAVLIGCLVALDAALPFYWADTTLATKMVRLRSNDQIDTVFVGSSLTFNQIAPSVIDHELGTHSFNFGTGGAHGVAICRIIDELVQDRDRIPWVKTIVAEIRHPTVNNAALHTREGYYAFDLERTIFACRYHRSCGPRGYTQLKRSLLSFADNFAKRGMGFSCARFNGWGYDTAMLGPAGDGFYPLGLGGVTQIHGEREASLDELRDSALRERTQLSHLDASDTVYANYLLSLQDRAREQGIQVIYILPAKTLGLVSVLDHLGTAAAVDMGDPRVFPEFYEAELAFDSMHFNREGAHYFSEKLAAQLEGLALRAAE